MDALNNPMLIVIEPPRAGTPAAEMDEIAVKNLHTIFPSNPLILSSSNPLIPSL